MKDKAEPPPEIVPDFPDDEIARRRDEVVRRMIATPPQPRPKPTPGKNKKKGRPIRA
jgi:hypothetical protein